MGLRSKVMRGGVYLAIRQGFGVALSIASVLLVTRIIGPAQYGLYVGAFGIFSYMQKLARSGISLYLIREAKSEESDRILNQGLSLLMLLSILTTVVGFLILPFINHWVRLENFKPIAAVLFLSLPFSLCSDIPLAKLERELNYKKVAMIELANQCLYVLISVYLATQGAGAWSLVVAWWAQNLQSLVLFYWGSGYRPRFYWQSSLVKEILIYGVSFSASQWIYYLRDLVNPLIVGRFGGAEAVGIVALAIRIVEVLSFVKNATWRISIAALAQIQEDKPKLRRAITEGMGLQVLALGPVLVLVAWLLPFIIGLAFGHRWLSVVQIYPFIAFSSLTNSLFNLHSSTLYVFKKNWQVALFHFIHVALFAGGAWFLLPHMGLVGYGWAEVIALAAYGIIHIFIVKVLGSPNYLLPLLWWAVCSLSLFIQQLGSWAILGLVIAAMLPLTHYQIHSYWKSFKQLT